MKKFIIAFIASIMLLPMFGFVRVEYGVKVSHKYSDSTIYKQATVRESEATENGITKDVLYYIIDNRINNSVADYTKWPSEDVSIYSPDGDNYTGVKYEIKPMGTNLEYQVWAVLHDYADVKYTMKRGLFSRTITITLTPMYISKGIYKDAFANETEDYADYYMVLETPGDITSTNGSISSDGRRVEWNIEDQLRVKTEKQVMTVTYDDYGLVKYMIIAGVVLLLIIVGPIVFRRKKIIVETDSRYMGPIRPNTPPSSDNKTDENGEMPRENAKPLVYSGLPNPKCPECGNEIKDGGNFCENCGRFL